MALKLAQDEAESYMEHSGGDGGGGDLAKEYKNILAKRRIYEQRWWGGQLNGPDLRRLFENLEGIMSDLKAVMISKKIPVAMVDDLISKHAVPMRMLNRIGELMRTMRKLTPGEITELSQLCEDYGKSLRVSFPGEILTPKAHVIEKHIAGIAQHFGCVGIFGQDGAEAAHPKWKAASQLCRCRSNPIARMQATKRHFEARQHCSQIKREKKKRARKQQRERNEAAQAPAPAVPDEH
jgi:hypothetical protein